MRHHFFCLLHYVEPEQDTSRRLLWLLLLRSHDLQNHESRRQLRGQSLGEFERLTRVHSENLLLQVFSWLALDGNTWSGLYQPNDRNPSFFVGALEVAWQAIDLPQRDLPLFYLDEGLLGLVESCLCYVLRGGSAWNC